MSRAALALYEATGEARLSRARRSLGGDRRPALLGRGGGAYFFTADDTEALIARTKTAQDSPNPSGNGVMVGVLARLFYLTGKSHYRERAERIVAAFAGDVERQVFGFAALINGNELLQRALQIVVRGAHGEADTDALLRAISGVSLPNKVLLVVPPEARAARRASGRRQGPGRRPRHRLCLRGPGVLAAARRPGRARRRRLPRA